MTTLSAAISGHRRLMIFIGDDWTDDHHDIHMMDADGTRLSSRWLPEGLPGIRGFHELVAVPRPAPTCAVPGPAPRRSLGP
jgi:hypothetical protein